MAINRGITREPNGSNDSNEAGALGDYAGYRPFRYHDYFNDFDDLITGDFTVTKSAGSSAPIVVNADGGQLQLNNAGAGASDFSYMQWAGGAGASRTTFTWGQGVTPGNVDLFMQFQFSVDDATNSNVFLGLEQVTVTPFTFLDSIGLFKAQGATTMALQLKKGATVTTSAGAALVAATLTEVTIGFTTVDQTWRWWVNNVYQGQIVETGTQTPITQLAMTIALLNATAVAHTLNVDYVMFSNQRLNKG